MLKMLTVTGNLIKNIKISKYLNIDIRKFKILNKDQISFHPKNAFSKILVICSECDKLNGEDIPKSCVFYESYFKINPDHHF